MNYVNGLIKLLISLVISTVIIYFYKYYCWVWWADYTFTNGEAFVIWILMAILVNNCLKK